MDKKGIFYSVGVGPGDRELMTYRAVKTIEMCEIIAVPESGGEENLAVKIAGEHLEGKRVVRCQMPMIRDKVKLRESHERAANEMREYLEAGQSVAYLTLGDPAIYSTALYVHQIVADMGYRTQIIPGVTSFSAAAAALNKPLCMGGEPLHIIPASYGGEIAGFEGTTVLMKSGKALGGIIKQLRERGDVTYQAVNRASLEDERVLTQEEAETADYFTIVVVKRK